MIQAQTQCNSVSTSHKSAPAKQMAIGDYLPFVRKVAAKVHRHIQRQIPAEELEALGMTGLLEAYSRYVPGGPASFETFAYYRVRGAMLDGLGDIAPLSRKAYRQAKSTDQPLYMCEHEEGSMPDRRQGVSPLDIVKSAQTKEQLEAAISLLDEDEQLLVRSYYYGELSLVEAGRSLGLSKFSASRKHTKALARLRKLVDPTLSPLYH